MGAWDDVDAQLAEGKDPSAVAAPAPPPAPRSAWDVADAEVQRDELTRDARLRLIFERGLQKSPEEHAAVAELTRQTRLPADVVESQLPLLRQRAQAAQFDPARFRAESPELESLLLDHAPAEAAPVVMQDGLLKRTLRGIGRVLELAGEMDAPGASPDEIRGNLEQRSAAGELPQVTPGASSAAVAPRTTLAQPSPSGELSGLERAFGRSTAPTGEGESVVDQGDATAATSATTQAVPGIYEAGLQQGFKAIDYSKMGAQVVALKGLGRADEAWALEKKALDMKREMGPRSYNANPLESIFLDAADLFPSQLEVLKAGGVAGGIAKAATYGTVYALTRSAEAASKASGAAYRKVAGAASFATSFGLEMGGAYLDYGELRTDDGAPVGEDVRMGAAVAYGLVAAAVEVDALKPYLEMFGPIGDAIARGEGKAFVRGMLKDATFRQIVADAGRRWMKGAYAEGREEAIQQIAQDVFGYYAKARQAGIDKGGVIAPQATDIGGSLLEAADVFSKTFWGTLATGAAGAVSTIATHEMARKSDESSGAVIAHLAQLGEAASTRAAPALVAKLVEDETAKAGEPVKAAYLDAGAILRLFQSAPGGLEAAAQELGFDVQEVKEAAAGANGGRLEVPLATYLEKWGPKGVAQALAGDTALRPGGSTVREQITKAAEVEKRRVELVAAYDVENPPAPESKEEQDALDAVAAQLARTGVYDSKDARKATALVRAFVRTQAETLKLEPEVLFESFALTVDREESLRPLPTAAPAAAPGGVDAATAAEAKLTAAKDAFTAKLKDFGWGETLTAEGELIYGPVKDGVITAASGLRPEERDQVAVLSPLRQARSEARRAYEAAKKEARAAPAATQAPLAQPSSDPREEAERAIAAAHARLDALSAIRDREVWSKATADEQEAGLSKLEADPKYVAEKRAAEKELTRWQKRLKALGGARNLVVIHNLTGENLLHAVSLGGLAAPSIAVTRKEHPADGFGEITLIGGMDLIDPKSGVPIFDADVYSPRWPDTRWKVDDRKLAAFVKWFRPFAEKAGTYLSDLSGEMAKEGPAGLLGRREWRAGLLLAYLAEQGEAVEPRTRSVPLQRSYSSQPALLAFKEAHPDLDYRYSDELRDGPLRAELSAAARRAIDEYAAETTAAMQGDAEDHADLVTSMVRRDFDDAGLLNLNAATQIGRDLHAAGRTEVDVHGMTDAMIARLEADPALEAALQEWARPKLEAVTNGQFIAKWTDTQDGGKWRLLPYTLENILKEMTRKIKAQEAGFMSGLGSARAKGAKQFRTIEQIQAARDAIVAHDEFAEAKEEFGNRFAEVASALEAHFEGDKFRLLDGLAEAIGESYRRGHYLSKELELSGFRGVPAALHTRVAELAADLLTLPTEYFEAKPQRAVTLDEFKAAVVPFNVAPAVLEALKKAGVKVFTYGTAEFAGGGEVPLGPDLETLRQEAIAYAAEDRKVLFQPALHGSHVRGIDQFLTQYIGTGEGHQVFGWGLYFAGNRETAENYRKQNSVKHGIETRTAWTFLPADEENPADFMRRLMWGGERQAFIDLHGMLSSYRASFAGAGDKVLQLCRDIVKAQTQEAARFEAEATRALERAEFGHGAEFGSFDELSKYAADMKRRAGVARQAVAEKQAALDLVAKFGLVPKPPVEAGQLYKVEIPDNDVLLDFDAPLSKQPAKVQEAIRQAFAFYAEQKRAEIATLTAEVKAAIEQEKVALAGWKEPRLEVVEGGGWQVVDGDGKPTTGEVVMDGVEAAEQLRQDREHLFEQVQAPSRKAYSAAADARDEAQRAVNALTSFKQSNFSKSELLGADVYRILEHQVFASDPRAASEAFAKLGVPGMRYLDQGSRGKWEINDSAPGEVYAWSPSFEKIGPFASRAEAEAAIESKRSRNFVVWDDTTIKVLETFYQPAWHGTRHKGIARFSLQKIGTGEGAQAYGWGLYFAEDRTVASYYRETLSSGRLLLDGERIEHLDDQAQRVVGGHVSSFLNRYGSSIEDAIVYARGQIRNQLEQQAQLAEELRKDVADAQDSQAWPGLSDGFKAALVERVEIAEGVAANLERALHQAETLTPDRFNHDNGQLYRVELPEKSELLDYDLPLAEQEPAVLEKLRAAGLIPEYRVERIAEYEDGQEWGIREYVGGVPTSVYRTYGSRSEQGQAHAEMRAAEENGEHGVMRLKGYGLYHALVERFEVGLPQENRDQRDAARDTATRLASEALDAAGIPGMKYLDGGSRGPDGGTHNFVIWNEDRVAILETMYQRKRDLTPEQKERLGALEAILNAEVDRRTRELRDSNTGPFPEEQARAEVFGPEAARRQDAVGTLVREALYLRGYDVFEQPGGGEKRGYVDMLRDGLRHVFRIVFTQKADLTTFLHETGHVFLEMMGDLAERPDASKRLTEDWQRTLKWLGVKDRSGIQREHHEKWAQAFERYLMEGKAPSLALVGSFTRFRLWLRDVYSQLTAVSQDLDDDIRGVFDRMLATDAEIERAKAAMGASKPQFRSPAEAGMTPEQFQAYLDDREESFKAAAFETARRSAEEQLRATDSFLKGELSQAAKDAELEFAKRPEQVAVRFLRTGDAGGNPALQVLVDIARDQAREAAGADTAKLLTDEQRKRLTAIAREMHKLELGGQVEALAAELVAKEGLTREAALERAAKEVQLSNPDPTAVPSPVLTRPVVFMQRPGMSAVPYASLDAVQDAAEIEQGFEIRPVALPAWLHADEFAAAAEAWGLTWDLLTSRKDLLVGRGKRKSLFETDIIRRSGLTTSEPVQRLVFEYVKAGQLEKAYAVGRLLTGRGEGDFARAMREQVRTWLNTVPFDRKFDDPLSPKQWGFLLRDVRAFKKWQIDAKDRLAKGAPWVGDVVTFEEAKRAPQTSKVDETTEAQLAALRAEQGRIQEAALTSAADKVRPRLDYRAAVAVLGADVVKEKLRGLTQLEAGLAPDDLAQILEQPSGADLLHAIANGPTRKAWVDSRAQELLAARRPDVMAERARLAEIATQALHNAGSSDWLLKEWVALRRKAVTVINQETGKSQQVTAKQLTDLAGEAFAASEVPLESIRLAARDIADRAILRDIAAGRALQAERSAADRAATAAAKGDYRLAYVEKQKQLLNHYLYKYLTEARDQRAALEKLGARMADPKRRMLMGKVGGVFLPAADTILEAFGFKAPETDPAELAARPTMPDVTKALEEQQIAVTFDAARLSWLLSNPPKAGVDKKGRPLPAYLGLTVGDARLVGAALSQLYVAARDLHAVMVEGKRVEIAELLGTIHKEASERNPVKPPPPGSDSQRSGGGKAKRRLEGLDAALADPEQLLKDLGPTAYRFFWRGYLEARDAEDGLAQKVFEFIDQRWADLPAEMQRRRYDLLSSKDLALVPFPADVRRDGAKRDRMWAWMVALNMGNRSNMERLLGGYGWEEAKVREFLDAVLTDEEWTFIEGVWALLDKELYPSVEAQFKRINGVKPEKIEALPFTLTSGRVISGGYFPARYDPIASRVGENQRQEALSKLYGQKAGQYSIARSFTKERVKKYEDVINLQWGEVPRHVGQVIHYIAFDSFIRDAARVMGSSAMQDTVSERLGESYYPQLEQWLRTAASDQADAVPEHLQDVQWALGELRSRFVMQTLGLSLTVAAGDLSNPLVAVAAGQVKARYMAPALAKGAAMIPSMFTHKDEPHRLSTELTHRRDNMRRKVKHELQQIGAAGKDHGFHAWAREVAWVTMEATDLMTSTVIWMAAHAQAQARGLSARDAVLAADEIVRANMPSHDLAEQPAFLRDKRGVGAVVAFYGYFSKLYNVERSIWRPATVEWQLADSPGEKVAAAQKITRAAGRTLAVIIVTNMLAEMLSGRGPEDDEGYGEWMLRKLLAAPFSWVPLVGAGAEWAVNAGVSKAFHGKSQFRSFSARASPAAAGVEKLVRALGKVVDSHGTTDDRVWALLEAYGFIAKVPLGGQIPRTGRAITHGEVGRDLQGGRPFEAAGDVIYGKNVDPLTGKVRSPKNPGSAFQDLVDGR